MERRRLDTFETIFRTIRVRVNVEGIVKIVDKTGKLVLGVVESPSGPSESRSYTLCPTPS